MNEEIKPLTIYVGWDSREDIAYQICRQSILEYASVPVKIVPLKQKDLKKAKYYSRRRDKLASTEFTFTRYLIPALQEYQGWALFIDCDFLFKYDIKALFDKQDPKYALMCAKHNYKPKAHTKMDGQQQTHYPRKNWSSMMLINCEHPSNRKLTVDLINDEDKTGAYFHRFSWLKDNEIGSISHEWNWLVNWYLEPEDGSPKALHYTEGGPWFDQYKNCDYALDWHRIEAKYLRGVIQEGKNKLDKETSRPKTISTLHMPLERKELFQQLIRNNIDPENKFYETNEEEIMTNIKGVKVPKAAAIDSAGGINYNTKGLAYDEYLEALVIGWPGAVLSDWASQENTNVPLIIRGLGGGSRKAIKHCWETKRQFYAIDTGYFGNGKSKSKGWHRITKNALQFTGEMIDRPSDRLKRIGYSYQRFTPGRKIMICPPSEKVMLLWGQPEPEVWVENVIQELKQHTSRPIEVRLKPNRTERISTKSMEEALQDDIHCLVTYNSIAATEALMNGKPAIALGPNAASALCNSDLSEVENLNLPSKDDMMTFMKHLSYCQFTKQEMMNGVAWNIVNESN